MKPALDHSSKALHERRVRMACCCERACELRDECGFQLVHVRREALGACLKHQRAVASNLCIRRQNAAHRLRLERVIGAEVTCKGLCYCTERIYGAWDSVLVEHQAKEDLAHVLAVASFQVCHQQLTCCSHESWRKVLLPSK